MPWTIEQQQAINQRKANLLVSAAAGSGKTAVLVERIIQLIINEENDIDRMLIVTFTKAAAGEMRERIGRALMKTLNESDEKQNHLRKQLAKLGNASISTIHSFCSQLIKKYFYLLELDPAVRIADDAESTMIEQQAIKDAMELLYYERNKDYMVLCDNYAGERSDRNIRELVLKIYHEMMSQPDPFEWLHRSVKQYNVDEITLKEGQWYAECKQFIQRTIDSMSFYIEKAERLCKMPGGPAGYLDTFEKDIQLINTLKQAIELDYDAFAQAVEQAAFVRLGRCSKDVDPDKREQAKNLRDNAKKKFKAFEANGMTRRMDVWAQELKHMLPAMRGLELLLKTFDTCLKATKAQKKVIDYADLEHYALALLNNTDVSAEVSKQYDYIFVDEYQDSNSIQECIISHIKRNNNVFMVGDVKQSIYRFRQADPSIFLKKYETFSTGEQSQDIRIDLNRNFRSHPDILHAINGLFKAIMNRRLGEMEYDEKAHLYPGMQYPTDNQLAIGLTIVEMDKKDDEASEMAKIKKEETEACAVANAIQKMHGQPLYDAKKDIIRPAMYRDMAVLMRTIGSTVPVFTEVFTDWNIPVFADVQTGYFDSIEVNVFLNLLRIIDNRRQDIPLLSVLKSAIGRFSESMLADIRIHRQKGLFSEAFFDYANNGIDDKIKSKVNRFITQLDRWRNAARNMELEALIWMLFEETNYYHYVGAMPGGTQRKLNLEMLADKAAQFEQTALKGLFNFLRYIERIESGGKDFGVAKALGENDDVVHMMSIHKSKGLEFPIVFVAGLGRKFNLQDTSRRFMTHKELGIGAKYINASLHCSSVSFAQIAMKQRIHDEMLAEELRVLYVALTRAKNKCHLFGTTTASRQQFWQGGTNSTHLLNATCFLDWIGAYLVTSEEIAIDNDSLYDKAREIDGNLWGYQYVNKQEVLANMPVQIEVMNAMNAFEKPCSTDWIRQRLMWEYAYHASAKVPSKLSVTEIKRLSAKVNETEAIFEQGSDILALRELYLQKRPAFMETKKQLSPVERGIAMHFAMQHLDLHGDCSEKGIQEQIYKLMVAGLMTEEQVAVINVEKLNQFIDSDIGKRMKVSKDIRREIPFNLVKRASKTSEQFIGCEEDILIQGIIDCCFLEDDQWILVDYKTDAVIKGKEYLVADRYRVQLQLYKEALIKITGKNVKESFIYLFSVNKAIRLEDE